MLVPVVAPHTLPPLAPSPCRLDSCNHPLQMLLFRTVRACSCACKSLDLKGLGGGVGEGVPWQQTRLRPCVRLPLRGH